MIEIIKEELSKYKDKDVEILINEGRSKKRKEKGKIKNEVHYFIKVHLIYL